MSTRAYICTTAVIIILFTIVAKNWILCLHGLIGAKQGKILCLSVERGMLLDVYANAQRSKLIQISIQLDWFAPALIEQNYGNFMYVTFSTRCLFTNFENV